MKNEKLFLDNQGNVLKVGDRIMYVTDGPRFNYGIIKAINWKKHSWGYEHWNIKVWKEKGYCLAKPRFVHLTWPTLFKCDVVLEYPDVNADVRGM